MANNAALPALAIPDRHPRALAHYAGPRRGLSRDEAAAYVGIGTTKFDEMVVDKRMPPAFRIDGRVLWDIRKLDEAIDRIVEGSTANAWDGVE